MHQVNLREAESNLLALIEEVIGGGEVVIAQAGMPLAKLVPCKERSDPFDRMLIAQARLEGFVLVTHDETIHSPHSAPNLIGRSLFFVVARSTRHRSAANISLISKRKQHSV